MIDFTNVSREFHSLVERRRELLTLLGSIFAGMGIFLENVLKDSLPESLQVIESHLFAFYALVLLVSSMTISLRMARLHAGMVLNGVMYARLMEHQDWTKKLDPVKSAKHNPASASFLQFLMLNLISGSSAAVLAIAIGLPKVVSFVVGVGVYAAWLALYFKFHHQAAKFALEKVRNDSIVTFVKNEWEEHIASSLENTNKDLLGTLSFAGLMIFSLLETISALGSVAKRASLDIRADDIVTYAPQYYSVMMFLVCFLELGTYLRLRVALGRFSLERDPSDKPFEPLKLTDSLLGYILLAFFFAIATHLLQVTVFPTLRGNLAVTLTVDSVVFFLAILAEQLTLVRARRLYSSLTTPPLA